MEGLKKKSEHSEEISTTSVVTDSGKSCEPASSEELSEPANKRIKLTTESTTKPVRRFAFLQRQRRFKNIPIFIADYHNEVLEFIYRCLGSRHLPFRYNTLLHFDSHPDMVISHELPASATFDKEAMLGELSIENWIMPSCYAGHFSRIIWMKNSWCKQMPVGTYNFKVGHKEDILYVDCDLEYFISEGNYCNTAELEETKDIEFHVVHTDSENPPNPKEFLTPHYICKYILDIDLDFFSTANPFLEIYVEANCHAKLVDIFRLEIETEKNPFRASEKRKEQLHAIKKVFMHLDENRKLEGLEKPDNVSQEVFDKIGELAEVLSEVYADDEIDWPMIYTSGCTTDSNGLPHHISTEAELNLYYTQFKEFLKNVPHPPVFITISRSHLDDYCPRDQVESIQEKVVEILQEVFGESIHKKPILFYMEEEWDVMKL